MVINDADLIYRHLVNLHEGSARKTFLLTMQPFAVIESKHRHWQKQTETARKVGYKRFHGPVVSGYLYLINFQVNHCLSFQRTHIFCSSKINFNLTILSSASRGCELYTTMDP